MSGDDSIDDLEFSIEDDIASTGAAADSSDLAEPLAKLPRILRYAMLVGRHPPNGPGSEASRPAERLAYPGTFADSPFRRRGRAANARSRSAS